MTMWIQWCLHEPWNQIHCIHNGRPYCYQIHQDAYQYFEQTWIYLCTFIFFSQFQSCCYRCRCWIAIQHLEPFKTSFSYFDWQMKIPSSVWLTSMPKKYFIKPKSVISNSFFIVDLKNSIQKFPVNIKSSTYRHTIKTSPSLFTLM